MKGLIIGKSPSENILLGFCQLCVQGNANQQFLVLLCSV